ncbi:response regulator transcription factor [Nonomuraea antimicrobica]|uniref:Response regulator transcription factor n=1 Tax=Nonomuraea antimicrobica TaxID=561173 RepID=A0ABP7C1N7_9ACTN
MTEATRVLIVDDQELIRTGLGLLLGARPELEIVGEAADGGEALEILSRTPADVALMDVRMGGMDGIAATERMTSDFPGTRVVLLTVFDEDSLVRAGLAAGADGFMLKDTPPEELIRTIRLVAAGHAVVEPKIAKRLLDGYRHNLRENPSGITLDVLTPREQEVFWLVSSGLSNADIGRRLGLSAITVRTHVAGILAKFGLRRRERLIVHAYEDGLIVPMRYQRDNRPTSSP